MRNMKTPIGVQNALNRIPLDPWTRTDQEESPSPLTFQLGPALGGLRQPAHPTAFTRIACRIPASRAVGSRPRACGASTSPQQGAGQIGFPSESEKLLRMNEKSLRVALSYQTKAPLTTSDTLSTIYCSFLFISQSSRIPQGKSTSPAKSAAVVRTPAKLPQVRPHCTLPSARLERRGVDLREVQRRQELPRRGAHEPEEAPVQRVHPRDKRLRHLAECCSARVQNAWIARTVRAGSFFVSVCCRGGSLGPVWSMRGGNGSRKCTHEGENQVRGQQTSQQKRSRHRGSAGVPEFAPAASRAHLLALVVPGRGARIEPEAAVRDGKLRAAEAELLREQPHALPRPCAVDLAPPQSCRDRTMHGRLGAFWTVSSAL